VITCRRPVMPTIETNPAAIYTSGKGRLNGLSASTFGLSLRLDICSCARQPF
jgi:hypothetical protein